MKASFERRAISPAIATIGLISVAIAASIPAIAQLQTQARNSAPDTYAVSIDIVKLSDTKAWFYVNQSEAKRICLNILQDASAWGAAFLYKRQDFCNNRQHLHEHRRQVFSPR